MRKRTSFATLIVLLSSCTAGGRAPEEPETPVMPPRIVQQLKSECARLSKGPDAGVRNHFLGRDGWCYPISDLRYCAAEPFFGEWAQKAYPGVSPEDADPLNAILHFRDQLAAHDVELFFMLVPARPLIYPEGVIPLGEFSDAEVLPHIKPMQDDFLRLVREAGVREIDLTPYFLRSRRHENGPLFCKSDTHWTPSATALAAHIVSQRLKSRPWFRDALETYGDPSTPFTAQWLTTEHFGHCYRKIRDLGGVDGLPGETISYRRISGPEMDGSRRGKLRHPRSPIVILGDSSMAWWKEQNAGFPQELAYELGFHVDVLAPARNGVNAARLSFVQECREHPWYLDGKKAVLWTFTARAVLGARPCWVKTPLELE